MTPQHEYWIEKAIESAKKGLSTLQGGPFGAVIIKDSQLITSAFNTVTSSLDPTAHAEINAIRQACQLLNTYDLKGCILYSSCEPCPMCLGAILWARIDEVYYCAEREDAANAGFDDSCFYEEIQKSPPKRNLPMIKVDHPLKLTPFESWESLSNKKRY